MYAQVATPQLSDPELRQWRHRAATVPTSSATVLVSKTLYNDKGEAEGQTDPTGQVTRTTYDAAGRVLSTTRNHGSTPTEVVNMTFNPDGQLKTLSAVNSETGPEEMPA